MKYIPLTRSSRRAMVDDRDYAVLAKHRWSLRKALNNRFYAAGFINGRPLYMHQAIKPGHRNIDHRDCNGLNNRRRNLRPCTHSQNGGNARKASGMTSRYKGVHWHKQAGKWRAVIKCRKKVYWLGEYRLEADAGRAYNRAAKILFGRFARLNIICHAKRPSKRKVKR